MNTLCDRLKELGGQVFFRNIGKQLVRGGVPNGTEGRVDAVICLREDGTYAKYVGTKAVVLATGDFSANRETNYDIGFAKGGLYKGEGQQMGLWVGAAWQRTTNCIMGQHTVMPGPTIYYGCHRGLLVDRNGERFMNEYCSRNLGSETIYLQDEKIAFAIWDTAHAYDFRTSDTWTNGPNDETPEDTLASWEKKVDGGVYVKADTLEEAVEVLSLPLEKTMATIARYNELAGAGEDVDFHKPANAMFPIA